MWNRLLQAVGLRDEVAVEDPLAAAGRAPTPAKIEPDANAGPGGFASATGEEASPMVAKVNEAAEAAMPAGGPLGAELRFDPAALGGGEQELERLAQGMAATTDGVLAERLRASSQYAPADQVARALETARDRVSNPAARHQFDRALQVLAAST
jgi:hypothetical protein